MAAVLIEATCTIPRLAKVLKNEGCLESLATQHHRYFNPCIYDRSFNSMSPIFSTLDFLHMKKLQIRYGNNIFGHDLLLHSLCVPLSTPTTTHTPSMYCIRMEIRN